LAGRVDNRRRQIRLARWLLSGLFWRDRRYGSAIVSIFWSWAGDELVVVVVGVDYRRSCRQNVPVCPAHAWASFLA
jgi:hypothetical protein